MALKDLKSANLGLFDLFGTTPTFKIQGHKKHYSFCGLLLTLMVSAFVIWALVLTSGDLFDKRNPSLVTSELPGATFNETFALSPETFQVKIGLFDNTYGTLYLDKSFYTVRARFVNLTAETPADMFITLDLEVCQSNLVTEDYKYWCLKGNQSKLEGLYLNSKTFIQIDFLRCRNTTSGGTCATLDDINARLKKSIAQIEYLKWSIAPTDFEDPLKNYYFTEQQGVVVSLYKVINVFMKKMNFVSDNGWVVEDSKSQSVVYLENSVTDLHEAGSTTSAFFTYAFYPNGNEVTYTRKYTKIQDILAQVSGLASTFILIIGMLGRPFDEFKMYETVINTMYDIREKKFAKNSRFKPSSDTIRTQEPILRLRTFSEDRLPKKASFDQTVSMCRDDRLTKRTSNDLPSDNSRPKRLLDLPKPERKVVEKFIKRTVSFPQLDDLESQKEQIKEEELEIAEENQEVQEVDLIKIKLGNYNETESPEIELEVNSTPNQFDTQPEPNSAPNRFDTQLDSERRLIPHRMSSRNDIKLDRLKEITIPEDSVHKEDTIEFKDEKDEVGIEEVMDAWENNIPTPRGILRQTTIQSPSQGYIDTDAVLVRQQTMTNENSPAQAPAEEPGQELDISYFEWLFSFIRPTKKMKIFQRGMEELMKHLDIITLVRTLAEVDKLKGCLLNNKQRVVFDNLKKPKLYVDWNEYKMKSEAREEKMWSGDPEKVKPDEAYRSLKSLELQTGLDRKLTSMYEKGGALREI